MTFDTDAIACSLGAPSMEDRLGEWQAMLTHVSGRESIEGGLRVTFGATTPFDELMRLAIAEHDCCKFFNFSITVDNRGVALEVRVPDEALPIVHSLFGVDRAPTADSEKIHAAGR